MIEARLPDHYDPAGVDPERHAPWLMASLLEEGDSEDLRWLVARFGVDRLGRWVSDRGERQLSTRSLAFRRLVPNRDGDSEAVGEELWPHRSRDIERLWHPPVGRSSTSCRLFRR